MVCRASVSWPSVGGDVEGELKLFAQIPEFSLPWKLSLGELYSGMQTFSLAIDTSGTRLLASGSVDLMTGEGRWRIEEGKVDAAIWLATWVSRLGPALSDMVAQGALTVTGEGTFNQGQVIGQLKVEWREGALRHTTQGWALEGIVLRGEFAVDLSQSRLVSTAPFELTIGTIKHPRFGARNLSIEAELTERCTLALMAAHVEVAGGEMVVDPCETPLAPLKVDATLRISRVGLQDIVLLVPAAGLADARGRIGGEVQVKWNNTQGFQFGVGRLAISDEEPAIVRLSSSLGLLTGHVPQYIGLLPPWMGAPARWFRPENPAFDDLKSIELGKAELRLKTLNLKLTPEGDDLGRSAFVQIVAQPAQPGGSVKEVTFDVNVSGPLNEVLKLGLTQKFSVETH
jgi:hypothetical protein